MVKLITAKDQTLASGRPVFSVVLEIPSKKLSQKGFIHSSMGGNDWTFTKGVLDNFRTGDETNPANPIMVSIWKGGFFYGKTREQITVVLLKEAYTCIPL